MSHETGVPHQRKGKTKEEEIILSNIKTTGRVLPTDIKTIKTEIEKGSELTLEESIKKKQNL